MDRALGLVQQQKPNRKRFYILLSMMLSCCFVEYVFGLYIPQIVYLAIGFAMAITGDTDEIAALCICCIPLHTYVEFSFIVMLGMICHLAKNITGIRLKRCILPVVLMILWELLHCFMPDLNLMQFGGLCVPWIMIAIWMCTPGYKFDYSLIVRAFVLSIAAICCSLVGKMLYTAGWDLASVFVKLQRLGVEATDGSAKINPNTLGVICLFGVSGLFQLRMAGRGKKQDLFFMVVLLLFGVMTVSKTFFFCLLFAAILFLFATKGSTQRKLRYLFNAVLIGLVVLGISWLVMPELVQYYISRFFDADFTTGRIDTMGEYFEYMITHLNVLLWGIGLQDFSGRVLQMCPEAVFVPHNAIQELVLAWGLPGILLLVGLWTCMFGQARRKNKHLCLLNVIPFLVWLLKNMAGQMINSPYTMLLLGFIYLSMCTDLSSNEEQAAENDVRRPDREEDGIDLLRTIRSLWDKRIVLIAVSMAGAVLGFTVTANFVTPVYESTVLIYVNNSSVSVDRVADTISYGDIAASRILVNTYRSILMSRQTLRDAINLCGISDSYEAVSEMISADAAEGTEILKISVKNHDRDKAMVLANAIADVLPQHISDIIDGTSATVIDYAIAAERPISPSKTINTMVGGVTAFIIAAMLILWKAMQGTKIEDHDLAVMFPYPVLASIPELNDRES